LSYQQTLDLTSREVAPAKEPRGEDAGGVEDEQVPGVQQVREIREGAIAYLPRGAVHHQEP
jgi:hypothetical protein